jgi:RNA polymerase sigma-70 factor (ECF subfamily)
MGEHTDFPDAALVRAILDGDRTAFRALYDRHTVPAYQAAWRILGGSRHDADDAMQDTWIRAVASLDRWSGATPFGAWLRGIAVHVAIDMLRRQARFTDDPGDAVRATADAIDERLDLTAAMAALAPGYRAVLVLHDIEGFSHEEIGQRLGITAGTSKGQLFKARRAMRSLLGDGRIAYDADRR